MAFLLERDALNGKEGRAIATINGKQIELFGCRNIKADYSLDSSDLKLVGTRLVQKKTTGIQLSGSMTIVYGTPYFKQLVKNYMVTGAPPYFTLQIINDDPATSVGRQVAALYNCRINSGSLAQLDADADFLTEDVSFDFTHFELVEQFHDPDQLGGF
jgi:hypothetical protein